MPFELKRLIQKLLHSIGYEIRRMPYVTTPYSNQVIEQGSMRAGLLRSLERGVRPATVIDIGAAQGTWSTSAAGIFSEANFVLIEPLYERKDDLLHLQARESRFHVVNAAAGPVCGELNLYVTRDLDGTGIADNGTNATLRTVPMTTIDCEIERLRLPGPFLLKLDTHGYEVPILRGAEKILQESSLVVIECYGFRIAPQSLYFWEMCELMLNYGFRLIDIVDVLRRPKDSAFWQLDAFFVPIDVEVFQTSTYQ